MEVTHTLLGRGERGVVYLGRLQGGRGEEVALKWQPDEPLVRQEARVWEAACRDLARDPARAHVNSLLWWRPCPADRSIMTAHPVFDATLDAWARKSRSAVDWAAAIVHTLAGLEALHAAGYCHGDVSPTNVLCRRARMPPATLPVCGGRVRLPECGVHAALTDFGESRHVASDLSVPDPIRCSFAARRDSFVLLHALYSWRMRRAFHRLTGATQCDQASMHLFLTERARRSAAAGAEQRPKSWNPHDPKLYEAFDAALLEAAEEEPHELPAGLLSTLRPVFETMRGLPATASLKLKFILPPNVTEALDPFIRAEFLQSVVNECEVAERQKGP